MVLKKEKIYIQYRRFSSFFIIITLFLSASSIIALTSFSILHTEFRAWDILDSRVGLFGRLGGSRNGRVEGADRLGLGVDTIFVSSFWLSPAFTSL
jgi:hypothetical protein